MSTPGVQVNKLQLEHLQAMSPARHRENLPALAVLQEYIDQHSLQKVVEDVLNGCVKTKPDEPLTFMVRGEHSFDLS